MKLIILNKLLRDKIRGSFKKHKGFVVEILDPVEVVKESYYILNFEVIKRIKHLLVKSKYLDLIKENVIVFTIGDGSKYDLKYKQFLELQNEIQ